jgi:hypothetical protein
LEATVEAIDSSSHFWAGGTCWTCGNQGAWGGTPDFEGVALQAKIEIQVEIEWLGGVCSACCGWGVDATCFKSGKSVAWSLNAGHMLVLLIYHLTDLKTSLIF